MNHLTSKTSSMKAMVLSDIAKLELREVPRPGVQQYEVLVRVSAVGLCGTDFHIFSGQANYNINQRGKVIPLVEQPQILGHELVGIVEEVGSLVKDLHIGDRVVIDQGLNCLSRRRQPKCEYCVSGDSHQCQFFSEHGITGLPGGLAEYIAVPAVNAIPINSDLETIAAVLTEPLGCISHALDRGTRSRTRYVINTEDIDQRVRSILIFGAGPAGLLFIQYLYKVLNYDGLILVSEPNQQKRELASCFGAEVIDPQVVDLVDVVQEKTGGRRVEYLIDACGAGSVFKDIPALIRRQATVLLYGLGHAGVDLSVLNNLQFMEPTLVAAIGASGGFRSDGRPCTYDRALGLLTAKQIEVTSWITHCYQSLESVPQAFTSDHLEPDYIKGVLVL
ncbi:alcohol dehydrogenase catalytic domain-containing protein [Nostoc sp. 106C]|uniref:zinc-dependent alcohol dehydrogenase n=1 Tax=Nostoc sp. 106C TaxID=1932667 RepID=UPI000A38BB95|nr:alcohol dehydrogenase catalytic domain-containing protein [Nostoc sp. 106C]